MKNLYIKPFLLIVFIGVISCKAQQQYPLNTFLADIPPNAYVKDLNNELNPYIGTYKANFNNKEVTLFITKEENKLEESFNKNYYLDALIVKYIIKNSSGVILQDTKNIGNSENELYSYWIKSFDDSVVLLYSGTNCGVGWGDVFLKKLNTTQLSWTYYPEETIILPGDCPGNPDLTVYLPVTENLIFTKQ